MSELHLFTVLIPQQLLLDQLLAVLNHILLSIAIFWMFCSIDKKYCSQL